MGALTWMGKGLTLVLATRMHTDIKAIGLHSQAPGQLAPTPTHSQRRLPRFQECREPGESLLVAWKRPRWNTDTTATGRAFHRPRPKRQLFDISTTVHTFRQLRASLNIHNARGGLSGENGRCGNKQQI